MEFTCWQLRSIQVLVGWRRYTNGQVGQQEGQPALTFSDNALSDEKVKAGWPSCWPTCPLVYLRHPTSTWILRGCLVPWSVEESVRVDWGNPETSAAHRLSHYSIYALLGGMLTFRLFPTDVTNHFVISFRNCAIHPAQLHPPSVATSPWLRPHLPTQKSIHIP